MGHFPFSRVWSARAYQGKKRKINHPSLIRSLTIPPAASMAGGQSGDGQVVAASCEAMSDVLRGAEEEENDRS